MILIAANRLLKQDLQSLWYEITSLIFHEFVPVREYQILLWRNRTGVMVQKMLPRPQSWAKLREEANTQSSISRVFAHMEHWLPYFLLVYPHRFSASKVLSLVDMVGKASRRRI
jgi:hypothetical protein